MFKVISEPLPGEAEENHWSQDNWSPKFDSNSELLENEASVVIVY
jgi:hypothetical protein